MGFATNAIHVGQEPDPSTGAIVAPIYQTSTYVQTELGKDKGYDYARTNHPNRKALERTVAKLEGGHSAYVFSSGMAAIDAVFRLLRPGDHAIVSEAVYGGVFRLSTQLLVHYGLEFSFVDTSAPEAVFSAMRANTKMLYVETPTNPTLRVADLATMSKLANERSATLLATCRRVPRRTGLAIPSKRAIPRHGGTAALAFIRLFRNPSTTVRPQRAIFPAQ